MSSLSFNGNANSYLRIPNTDAFDFGTENFTIEWYQYQTDSNLYPRIFQVGSYPNINIGASIDWNATTNTVSTFSYWRNNLYNIAEIIPRDDYINKWVHFAITRSGTTRRIFMNGVQIDIAADNFNYNGNVDLVIGNESIPIHTAAFGGYIKYFTWVKGVALYTANFTFSTTKPTRTNHYVLLLTADDFEGSLGDTVVNNNVDAVVLSSDGTPTILNVKPPTSKNVSQPTTPSMRSLGPLFTNNAQVYYKPGSLASCGVGSVRNSRNKLRRI
jgi:hypothetical protein